MKINLLSWLKYNKPTFSSAIEISQTKLEQRRVDELATSFDEDCQNILTDNPYMFYEAVRCPLANQSYGSFFNNSLVQMKS